MDPYNQGPAPQNPFDRTDNVPPVTAQPTGAGPFNPFQQAQYQQQPASYQEQPPQQQVSPFTNSSVEQSYSPGPSVLGAGFLRSIAYLPEYVTMLIVLSALLAAVSSLFDIGIGYISAPNAAGPDSDSLTSGFSSGIETFQLVWSTATAIVAAPLFIFLYLRTRAVEKDEPAIKQHRWRRGFLGAFLAIEALGVFCMLIGLVFNLVARAVDKDGALYLMSDGAKTPVWHPILATVLGVALIGYVIWSLAKQYREREA